MLGEVVIPVDLTRPRFDKAGLTTKEVEELRVIHGFNEVTAKETPEWIVFLKRFLDLVPIVLIVAAILSVAIKEDGTRDWLGFGILIFTIFLMVASAHLSERNAKSALDAVRNLGTPMCHCRRDGKLTEIPTRELVPGDIIAMRAGTIIPADGIVVGEGVAMSVDESALTGETMAATKATGAEVLAGGIVQRGELDVGVTAIGEKSSYGKTISLISSVQNPGNLRLVLMKATNIITGFAAIFSIAIFIVILARDRKNVGVAFKISFVILASVIPAGMPVVTATVLAVGSKIIAAEDGLVQRLSAIEEMAGMEILCSDKTGTLTLNQLSLIHDQMYVQESYTEKDLMLFAALASNTEHAEPIDRAVMSGADMHEHAKWKVHGMVPFDPVNKKVIVDVTSPDGRRFRVIKGAPHIVLHITADPQVLGESVAAAEQERQNIIINERASRGYRTLGVCIEEERPVGVNIGEHDVGVCKLVGYISLHDPPRPDTKQVIAEAAALGVEVKMITGDQLAIAIETARQLGMGTNIASSEVFSHDTSATPFWGCANFAKYCESVSGFAGVYPEHKFKVVQTLMEGGNLIGMTGDGVNDAPALKAATVGVAVQGATEAASSAADIVLKRPGLGTIITAIKLSRQIFRRIESYITYRIASSIFVMLFYFIGIVAFEFFMPSWVVLFIAVVNDITIIFCSKDNVPTSDVPLHWNMTRAASIGCLVGCMSCIATIVMYLLAHPKYVNWWSAFAIEPYPEWNDSLTQDQKDEIDGLVVCVIYICIGLIIQTNFLACRARQIWFHFDKTRNMYPNILVLSAMFISVCVTFILAIHWPKNASISAGSMTGLKFHTGDPSGLKQAMLVAAYAIVWFAATDCLKSLVYFMWNAVLVNSSDGNMVRLHTNPKSEASLKQRKAVKARQIEMQHRQLEKEGVSTRAHAQQTLIARMGSSGILRAGSSASFLGPVTPGGQLQGRVVVPMDSGISFQNANAISNSDNGMARGMNNKIYKLEAKVNSLETKLDAVLKLLTAQQQGSHVDTDLTELVVSKRENPNVGGDANVTIPNQESPVVRAPGSKRVVTVKKENEPDVGFTPHNSISTPMTPEEEKAANKRTAVFRPHQPTNTENKLSHDHN